jgi:hypothetical protein
MKKDLLSELKIFSISKKKTTRVTILEIEFSNSLTSMVVVPWLTIGCNVKIGQILTQCSELVTRSKEPDVGKCLKNA